MQSLDELAQLAALVRATAGAIATEIAKCQDSGASGQPSAEAMQIARSQLGLGFQCLARAAHALGMDAAPER